MNTEKLDAYTAPRIETLGLVHELTAGGPDPQGGLPGWPPVQPVWPPRPLHRGS